MPNAANINAPACLVGAGRSGTTLVTAALRQHPEMQAIGETGNLVFSTFHTIERSLPLCGSGYDAANATGAAHQAVQRMLLDLFPSDRPGWFHKPIMIPEARRHFATDDAFFEWYWRVSRMLFPQGRWFTVVRDWRDVAVSAMQRWGWKQEAAIISEIRLHKLLLHRDSNVGLVLDFEDLTQDPEGSIGRLLAYLGLDFHPRCLRVFERIHAPNVGKGDKDTIEALRERAFRHEAGKTLQNAELDGLHAELRRRAAVAKAEAAATV